MFCFQCEQTAGGRGCTGSVGVCGKRDDTANRQDQLTAALVTLAGVVQDTGSDRATDDLVLEALFTTITNVNFDASSVQQMTARVQAQRHQLVSTCRGCKGCATQDDFDMHQIWDADEDIRSLKSLILFGLKGLAAYAHHALNLGHHDRRVMEFVYRALVALGTEQSVERLLPLVMQTGEANLRAMELLDHANTSAYGTPSPTTVSMTIQPGPFIVISGHDLHDLHLLLEQTRDLGINVYTHSEMLPAHGYPRLRAYPHLRGHFGTAWQNQQREFDSIPAPILFTTNCLMPVRESYRDRVFTTAVVRYPELVHIGTERDFRPVIARALELGGWPQERTLTGLNGGSTVTTGFGHGAVMDVAGQVVAGIQSGAVRRILLVGGCDGARVGRNYYTEVVRNAPSDTIILTLACGKYRFNDLQLGTIGTLPRLMDMGQCNDAFSAISVALALSRALGCSVNELPLSLVLSWYEQKAVAILLTLLHLGIRDILLGPSLPAFVSPGVLDLLVKDFGLRPISTPAEDLARLLGD